MDCGCTIWHRSPFGACSCQCHLTDDERADLALIASRKAAGQYADDMAPMTVALWVAGRGHVEQVAPWRFALEVD